MEHRHMMLLLAEGWKAREYDASKQWPSTSLNMEDVRPLEWVAIVMDAVRDITQR